MRYTEINIDEMRQLLRTEKGWYEASHSGFEHVFECPVRFWDGAVVKVFTSINKHNGAGRRKGGDCIRVCAVDLRGNRGLHKSVRVLRVMGWRDNLKNAVVGILRELHKRKARDEKQ